MYSTELYVASTLFCNESNLWWVDEVKYMKAIRTALWLALDGICVITLGNQCGI